MQNAATPAASCSIDFKRSTPGLLAQIEHGQATLSPESEPSASTRAVLVGLPVILIAALLFVVILGFGAFAVAMSRSRPRDSVDSSETLSGWLLTTDTERGTVHRDRSGDWAPTTGRETGQQRVHFEQRVGGCGTVARSPADRSSGGRIHSQANATGVEIDTLDGQRLKSFDFAGSYGQIVAARS